MSDDRPAFDLVVATIGRVDELEALLASIERQSLPGDRVVVVDQNDDDRIGEAVDRHADLIAARIRSAPGLSRARNAALGALRADAIVGFPDDDCTYPDGLLDRIRTRFEADPALDGLTGRTADEAGGRTGRTGAPGQLTPDTVWNGGNSASMFLRAGILSRVGGFDETLGLGSGTPWSSGEDIDLLVRAVAAGSTIVHDPTLVVTHPRRRLDPAALRRIGARDGASVGVLLGKHHYPPRVVARMLVRPLGGAMVALVRLDATRAGFQLATFRGRLRGYRASRRSPANSSS